ncbi:MAG TPA: N-6 DNA methylase [Vicinamibacterales bacterium]|nr:N-6 DNA methylase [Vicinamibacterales bacterium]
MIPGLRGSLLSHDALTSRAAEASADGATESIRRQLASLSGVLLREGGPTWPARVVYDRFAVPFCTALGFAIVPSGGDARSCRAWLCRGGTAAAAMAAFGWGADPGTLWRDSVRTGIGAGVRWCYAFTGPSVRIFDARRTHSRRYVEFDVRALAEQPATSAIGGRLLSSVDALDAAVVFSERHRAAIRDSLQAGVHEALGHLTRAFASATGARRRQAPRAVLLDESLVVVYRILFLLFAEARGLVPGWHPVFRESYTIEALRGPVETLPRPRGIWEALQAIARLAHHGCRAGALRVPPFNGRLFSPAHAPLAEVVPLDEAAVRLALLSLTTRRSRHGRERIAYADLGVEHLGGVYERVLDYDVQPAPGRAPALVRSGRRKATGSFYTPRSLTEYLVRRTLAPLVTEATPAAVLALRVLDPAMGSGAFLVAACRYLAHAYECALIRQDATAPQDISESDRATFRRMVAQRCLFGVDLNPMAVQLARLSLWLATLAGDRPLTFFDHHLRAGNSLVGAGIADVRRRRSGRKASDGPRPLFDETPLDSVVGDAVASRQALREEPEDTLEQVRAKEALFARIQAADAPLNRWKAIADLWCAGWFGGARDVPRGTFEALVDSALGRPGLPSATVDALLARASDPAARERFFHWELEFADVFHGADGAPLARPGFDAILGNPPWEMLRGDSGDRLARERASGDGSRLTKFARGSGIYRLQGTGQANLYQMFTERALALLRRGGRLGLVLPSGFATDHGCAALRRHVLESTSVDSFVSVENREGLFPIHRGLKFVLVTLEKKGETKTLPLRAGIRSAGDFDTLPESGPDPDAVPVSRRLIEQLSGEQLAIPELRTPLDAGIAGRIAFSVPAAGDQAGWHLRFGRELNATDDRRHFNASGKGLPVIEGKQIQPFTVDVGASRHHVAPALAERLLGRRPFDRSRLTYRDVASSTNKLTLIAAVLPAGAITTHTLFCLKTLLDDDAQQFVAGMFNSFVANYLVRLRVTTHVTVSIIERLPLPKPARSSGGFQLVADRARVLARNPGDIEAQAELQAAAARLYGLDAEAFAHVLSTFPLVGEHIRAAALTALTRTI